MRKYAHKKHTSSAGASASSSSAEVVKPSMTEKDLERRRTRARMDHDDPLMLRVEACFDLYYRYNEAKADCEAIAHKRYWYNAAGSRYTTSELKKRLEKTSEKQEIARQLRSDSYGEYSDEVFALKRIIRARTNWSGFGLNDKPDGDQMHALVNHLRVVCNEKCELLNTNLDDLDRTSAVPASDSVSSSGQTLHRDSQETLRSIGKAQFHAISRRARRAQLAV